MNTLKLLAALLLTAAMAEAKPHFNIKVNGKDAVEGPVKVAKGEVKDGDIVARGSVTVEGVVNGDCVSMDGSVSIAGSVNGDVASLGSTVFITGTVSGDVASLGGPVTVEGRVHGDVAAMGGDVTLGPKSEINGSVALLGGKLKKADGAKLNGSVTQLDLGMGKDMLRMAAKLGRRSADPEIKEKWRLAKHAASLAFYLGTAFMVLLLTALLPRQTETVTSAVKGDLWRSAGIGLLILIAVVPVNLLMLVSVIGIPLLPVAAMAFGVACLLSLAAFSQILAERSCESMGRPAPALLGRSFVGYLLLISPMMVGELFQAGGIRMIGGMLSISGVMLLAFGTMVGLGAVWSTRFGTRNAT